MKTQRKENRSNKSATDESSDQASDKLGSTLQAEVDEAQWSWLKPHAARDAVILISGELNLVEVGLCLAADDAATVQAWMEAGKITKPHAAQIQSWDAHPARRFLTLVIQPYVLAQEITLH